MVTLFGLFLVVVFALCVGLVFMVLRGSSVLRAEGWRATEASIEKLRGEVSTLTERLAEHERQSGQ